MKTKMVYLLGLLALLLLITSCDKEEIQKDDTFFLDIENEVITEELVNVPAYVWFESRDITVVCYSQYAHEYGELLLEKDWDSRDETREAIYRELITHLIGISSVDYKNYQIGLNKNVLITASITNNKLRPIEDKECSEAGGLCPYLLVFAYDVYKAYLKDVKQFN